MKYLIAIAGITLITLKATGFSIDLPSLGIYVFISVILLVKDFGSLKRIKGFGVEVEFEKELQALALTTEKIESTLSTHQKNNNAPDQQEIEEGLKNMIAREIEIDPEIDDDSIALYDLEIDEDTPLAVPGKTLGGQPETSDHDEIISQEQIDALLEGTGETTHSDIAAIPQSPRPLPSMAHESKTHPSFNTPPSFELEGSHPKIILINLSNNIEQILRTIITRNSPGSNSIPLSPPKMMEKIVFLQGLDNAYQKMFDNFWQLRNKVVHGKYDNIKDDKIMSLIDSGMRILKILQTIDNEFTAAS